MSLYLYIDVATGEARVSLSGAVRQRIRLFLNDLVPIKIAFVRNGAIVTNTVLEGGNATMKVGIRAKPGQGSILAEATTYTYGATESDVILPLNGSPLTTYFASSVPAGQNEAELFLEVQVTNQAGTTRTTYYQARCLVCKEVNA